MNNNQIIAEIKYDIDRGVYKMFPVLRRKLEYISRKLLMSKFIINAEYKLSFGEIKTLKENDYYKENY